MHTVEENPSSFCGPNESKNKSQPSSAPWKPTKTAPTCCRVITAARGAMNGLMAESLEGHIRFHVINPKQLSSEQALGNRRAH
jgi:hypothetical protein